MKLRLSTFLLVIASLLFTSSIYANSTDNSSEDDIITILADGITSSNSRELVVQYGENGGLLFSFVMYNHSQMNWSNSPGNFTNFKKSDSILGLPAGAGTNVARCNTQLGITPRTVVGSSSEVSLPYMGSYYVDPKSWDGYWGRTSSNQSAGSTFATRYSPFSITFKNQVNAMADPSMCMGGGSVQNSYTINH
ncbi:hypothetical protein ACH6EH_14095 [Paenibacillus sp. JSM ZJ436]|uniref:hypothetical protein n=1 Tax=Paenibacillus sp. JSM ZJ436 TaxID=3376190 RepID=UPI0037B44508